MLDTITLGPIIIKKSWLMLAIALAGGYLVYHYVLRNMSGLRETLNGLYINALVLFISAWKLSPLLVKPELFIHQPLVLIYYRPGNKETILALLIALGWCMFQLIRMKLSLYTAANALFLILSVTAFGYNFFTHHPLHIYYMLLYLLLTVICLYWKEGMDSPGLYRSCLVLLGAANAAFSFLQPYPYILGIYAPLFWVLVLLIGFILERVYLLFDP